MSQEQSQRPRSLCRGHRFYSGAQNIASALAVTALMAMLTSCGGGGAGSSSQQGTPSATGALQITTSTSFFPAFDPKISDYVAAAPPGSSLQVTVNAPPDITVSVDGNPSRTAASTTQVFVSTGQSFSFVVNASGSSKTYYVRCLPADFPAWATERPGTPQTEYYAFTPNIAQDNKSQNKHYFIIADSYGTPVWWYRSSDEPRNALFLPNGNIAWTVSNGGEEHKLNGELVRSFSVGKSNGEYFDTHELQQLPNGDYLLVANVPRGPVDLTAEGGFSTAFVTDNWIEEIAPNGSVVWRWSTLDHISLAETDPGWWPQYLQGTRLADPFHMNSIGVSGNGYVISFRHLDAVVQIDKASGNIIWKLGGTHRAESLTFSGDPDGGFGGQHDARILSDGTLTLHDNGTLLGRAPRAVRYDINTTTKTATLLEQVNDPEVTDSVCCGSARKVPGGNWVMEWGFHPVVTEFTPSGGRAFRMTFKDPYFSYRAEPVPFGVLDRANLRSGMDAQFPR